MRLRVLVPRGRRGRGLGGLSRDSVAFEALETIATVRGRHREFEPLVERIRGLGTDSVWIFGGDYQFEGGLRLQQRPRELAALLLYLRERRPRGAYLEIGTASGGTTRLIQEYVAFEQVLSLDDGQHPSFHLQEANLAAIPNVTRHIGDSHAPAARRFIAANLETRLALALIDGDHSYDGLVSDTRLVLSFAESGTLLVYHDTVAVADVGRQWEDGARAGWFVQLAHFVESPPISLGIGIAEVT